MIPELMFKLDYKSENKNIIDGLLDKFKIQDMNDWTGNL